MAKVERLLAEQKATDYRSPEDHGPTNACTSIVDYLSCMLESAFTVLEGLEGLNKQASLTELGN
ncbi:hypothetical protein PSY24_23500, partial [Shigella flexneri]|nr:hypothetical protein [Shigella flexneri]